jgi:hypothetical protein
VGGARSFTLRAPNKDAALSVVAGRANNGDGNPALAEVRAPGGEASLALNVKDPEGTTGFKVAVQDLDVDGVTMSVDSTDAHSFSMDSNGDVSAAHDVVVKGSGSAGSLVVADDAAVEDLEVAGVMGVDGASGSMHATHVTSNGDAAVGGDLSVGGSLNAGHASVNDMVTVSAGGDMEASGSMHVDASASVAGELAVDGSVSVAGGKVTADSTGVSAAAVATPQVHSSADLDISASGTVNVATSGGVQLSGGRSISGSNGLALAPANGDIALGSGSQASGFSRPTADGDGSATSLTGQRGAHGSSREGGDVVIVGGSAGDVGVTQPGGLGGHVVLQGGEGATCTADLCTNECSHDADGDCDDGGDGSQYSSCAFGSDCTD